MMEDDVNVQTSATQSSVIQNFTDPITLCFRSKRVIFYGNKCICRNYAGIPSFPTSVLRCMHQILQYLHNIKFHLAF